MFFLDDDDSRGIPDTEIGRVLQLKTWKCRFLSPISPSLFLMSAGIGYNLCEGEGGSLDEIGRGEEGWRIGLREETWWDCSSRSWIWSNDFFEVDRDRVEADRIRE